MWPEATSRRPTKRRPRKVPPATRNSSPCPPPGAHAPAQACGQERGKTKSRPSAARSALPFLAFRVIVGLRREARRGARRACEAPPSTRPGSTPGRGFRHSPSWRVKRQEKSGRAAGHHLAEGAGRLRPVRAVRSWRCAGASAPQRWRPGQGEAPPWLMVRGGEKHVAQNPVSVTLRGNRFPGGAQSGAR